MTTRPPRSAVWPVLATVLTLCLLIYGVSGFGRPVVRIDRIDAEGKPPVLHYGRDYRIEGVLDDSGNPYREIRGLYVQVSREFGRVGFGYGYGNADGADLDRVGKRFATTLHVHQGSGPIEATLKLQFHDRTGRQYIDWPGCSLPVRLE